MKNIFRTNKLKRVLTNIIGLRLGCELGHIENLIRPVDLRRPDEGSYKIASPLERFYIRIFGLPDTIKQQQGRVIFRLLEKFSFFSVLDVGCSYGHYSIRIAKEYPHSIVVGIDLDERRLNFLTLIDDYVVLRTQKLGSGILLVATPD